MDLTPASVLLNHLLREIAHVCRCCVKAVSSVCHWCNVE